jgi:hypothetical protein
MFDGSSIAGWKAINERHDPEARPRRRLCRPVLGDSDARPLLRHRRSGHRRALRPRPALDRQARRGLSQGTGIGDTVYVGPEAEFFMFDDVRFEDGYNASYFKIDDIELPTNTGREYEGGNLGHRPRAKGGYFPVAPVDSAMDIAARWSRPCSRWACRWTSTITRSPPPSTSSASPTARWSRPPTGCRSTNMSCTWSPCLRQDRDLHAQADRQGQRLGHAHPHVDLERRQAAVRRQRLCRASARRRSTSSAA